MTDPLTTYLQDHLAGAKFAINLLGDLSKEELDPNIGKFFTRLLGEVEADRVTLNDLVDRVGGDPSSFKEAAAWVAQKVGRFKLTVTEPIGLFEAVETLSLGVLGKLALWNALARIASTDERVAGLKLDELAARAVDQHHELEALRLQLAPSALAGPSS